MTIRTPALVRAARDRTIITVGAIGGTTTTINTIATGTSVICIITLIVVAAAAEQAAPALRRQLVERPKI